MRVIDANHLSKEVEESKRHNPHFDGAVRRTHNHEHDHFLRMIDDAPTIDAVPVVRCRECKYRVEVFRPEVENGGGICGKMYDTGKIEGYLCRVKPDDFCSYGERKGGADG